MSTKANLPVHASCAVAAQVAGESLLATAPEGTTDVLCLPFAGPWPAEAVQDAELPPDLRRLASWALRAPSVRPQLVRRVAGDPVGSPPPVVLARTGPLGVELAEAEAERLRPEHCAAFFEEGRRSGPVRPRRTPVVLVCVHGRRDACCARRGVAFAQVLRGRADGVEVLGTSHLGGHRFAATALVLPTGDMFGWLEPGDAPDLWAFAAGRSRPTLAGRYRGRIGRPAHVQAAMAWAFARTGELPDEEEVSVQSLSGNRATVRIDRAGAATTLTVLRRPTSLLRPKSCGEPPSRAVRVEIVEA